MPEPRPKVRAGELKTSGYEGIWPVRVLAGHDFKGHRIEVEAYRNMVTGELDECGDWNKGPSLKPTGDLGHIRHSFGGSDELWENLNAQRKKTHGTIVSQKPGRTVIRY